MITVVVIAAPGNVSVTTNVTVTVMTQTWLVCLRTYGWTVVAKGVAAISEADAAVADAGASDSSNELDEPSSRAADVDAKGVASFAYKVMVVTVVIEIGTGIVV